MPRARQSESLSKQALNLPNQLHIFVRYKIAVHSRVSSGSSLGNSVSTYAAQTLFTPSSAYFANANSPLSDPVSCVPVPLLTIVLNPPPSRLPNNLLRTNVAAACPPQAGSCRCFSVRGTAIPAVSFGRPGAGNRSGPFLIFLERRSASCHTKTLRSEDRRYKSFNSSWSLPPAVSRLIALRSAVPPHRTGAQQIPNPALSSTGSPKISDRKCIAALWFCKHQKSRRRLFAS